MIKTTIPYVLLTFLLVSLASCSRQYKIEGTSSITSLDGRTLYLKILQDGEWKAVDSAEVVHGCFSMKGKADSARMVSLYMDDESIMPLVLEDGKILVDISNSQLSAKGTPLNDALYEFIDKRNDLELKISDLERKEARMVLEGADVDAAHEQLTHEGESLVKEMNDYIKHFIVSNYDNVLAPNVFMMVCSMLPYPVMTPEIEEIMRNAPERFKQHPLVRDFLSKAKENMRLLEEQKRMHHNMQQAVQASAASMQQ